MVNKRPWRSLRAIILYNLLFYLLWVRTSKEKTEPLKIALLFCLFRGNFKPYTRVYGPLSLWKNQTSKFTWKIDTAEDIFSKKNYISTLSRQSKLILFVDLELRKHHYRPQREKSPNYICISILKNGESIFL